MTLNFAASLYNLEVVTATFEPLVELEAARLSSLHPSVLQAQLLSPESEELFLHCVNVCLLNATGLNHA